MRASRAGKRRELRGRVLLSITVGGALLLAAYLSPRSSAGMRTPRQEPGSACGGQQDARPLVQGSVMERDIKAGQTHCYELRLDAGQLVRLGVEPRTASLFVTLADPGGAKLDEFELPVASPTPHGIAFVADAPGVYKLEVRTDAQSPPGHYTLRVEELRAAAPGEKGRVEADQAFKQGAVLQYTRGDAESLRKAVEKYERAGSLWHAAGDRVGEAKAFGAMATVYDSLRENERAVKSYETRLQIVRDLKDSQRVATTSESVGRLYYSSLRDKAKALARLTEAARLFGDAGSVEDEARVLTYIGKVYLELGATDDERRESIDYFVRVLGIQRALNNRYYEGDTLGNLMFALKTLGRPREAIFFGKEAVNIFQEIRSGITDLDADTQETFVESREEIYRALAALLIEAGWLTEARHVIGLLKEEEYSGFINRAADEPATPLRRVTIPVEDAATEKRYRQVSDRLTAKGRIYGDLKKKQNRTPEEEQRLAELEAELDVAAAEFESFIARLKSEQGDSYAGQEFIRKVQDAGGMMGDLGEIGEGVVALFTLVSKDKYYIILVTPHMQRAFEQKINPLELNKMIYDFRTKLQYRDPEVLPVAQKLYRLLIGPVEDELVAAKAETLMWSFDWVLRYVPVAALHDGERYMVERYRNVIFTPAALTHLKDEPMEEWKGMGFGVSKAHDSFPPLPSVPGELRGIIFPETPQPGGGSDASEGVIPGRILLDEEFTEEKLKEMLRMNYPVVHIASHFKFRSGDGPNSYLLLGDGQHLSLATMKKTLRFDGVELLTLSACDTASGGEGNGGSEVESFAVLAQRRKAKAVMATLWPVSDESTPLLMKSFYRIRNARPVVTKAEALRQAQLALLHGDPVSGKAPYKHPYYWAPFLLIGNWK